jgi:hypothetical protein
MQHPLSQVDTFNVGTGDARFGGANISVLAGHYSGYDGKNELLYTTANFASAGPFGAISGISYWHEDHSFIGGAGRYQTDYWSGINNTGTKLGTITTDSVPAPQLVRFPIYDWAF